MCEEPVEVNVPDELVREVALVLGVVGVGVDGALGLALVEEVGKTWDESVSRMNEVTRYENVNNHKVADDGMWWMLRMSLTHCGLFVLRR